MARLLVLGNDIIPIAASAYNAGYQVYSIDFYGDSDLKHYCKESRSIIHQQPGQSCGVFSRDYDVNLFAAHFDDLISQIPFDGVILGSGLEGYPDLLEHIAEQSPLIGNHPHRIRQVRDTSEFFRTLRHLHISHPETRIAYNLDDAKRIGTDLGYPLIIKPTQGFGGIGIQQIPDQTSLQRYYSEKKTLDSIIIQEYIQGTPASVSTLSTHNHAVAISVNEQLIGLAHLGAPEPYNFCGNIVPLDASLTLIKNARSAAQQIIRHFNLIGSNGIDFIATEQDECFVIEVNPRMQGTLECLERVYDINLVTAHIHACTRNEIPEKAWSPRYYCARLIMYASQTIRVPPLSHFPSLRDIPLQQTIIEQGEPLCSILAEGSTRKQALDRGLNQVAQVRDYIAQKQKTSR